MARNPRAVDENNPIFSMPLIEREGIVWDAYDTATPTTMRKTRPVNRGDIIRFRKHSDSPVRRGIVLAAGSHYLDRRGEWCSWYNVVPEIKGGAWARLWVRVYDGWIERGYEEPGNVE